MNTETPTTAAIAELWREFEFHQTHIELNQAFLDEVSDSEFDPYREAAAKDIVCREDKIKAIRAQLIERCRVFKGTRYEIHDYYNILVTFCMDGEFENYTADDLKELSGIAAFWAWELEQRQKESQEAPI